MTKRAGQVVLQEVLFPGHVDEHYYMRLDGVQRKFVDMKSDQVR